MNYVNALAARTRGRFKSDIGPTLKLRRARSFAIARSLTVSKSTVSATTTDSSVTATANASNAKTQQTWS